MELRLQWFCALGRAVPGARLLYTKPMAGVSVGPPGPPLGGGGGKETGRGGGRGWKRRVGRAAAASAACVAVARRAGAEGRAFARGNEVAKPPFSLSKDVSGARKKAMAAKAPEAFGTGADLVDVENMLHPTCATQIQVDLRYAGRFNFLGLPLYDGERALLRREAAEGLLSAHADLVQNHNVGIKIWDAYRPWHVSHMFYTLADPSAHGVYVANAELKGSKHNRGLAVDITLFDVTSGAEILMQSAFDDFGEAGRSDYSMCTDDQIKLRETMQAAMKKANFKGIDSEWWHWDYQTTESNPPLLNVTLLQGEALARKNS